MNITTLLKYLVGRREAILTMAASRDAVWVGLLFVLSAGLAREYDGEDLLREPWHLLIPLGASLATSLLLYWLVKLVARARRENAQPLPDGYRSFLGLYWMTAPLAWLYGIPVERFMSVGDAVAVNLWLLGIVAFWRVVLLSRVISVLYGWKLWAALFVVMLFADAVALAILFLTPLPVFDLMGGIRLTEGEQLIRNTANNVGFLGVLTLPVWLIGTAVVASGRRLGSAASRPQDISQQERSVGLSYLAIASLVGWTLLLPWAQPAQQNRRQVERLMQGGRVAAGLEYMSARTRADFPPHWDPPPRIGYGERAPTLAEVLDGVATHEPAEWVTSLYVDKAIFYSGHISWRGEAIDLHGMDDEQLSRLVRLLGSTPKRGPELAATFREQLRDLFRRTGSDRPSPPSPGSPRRALLDELLMLAHQHDGGPPSLDAMRAASIQESPPKP